MVQRTTSCFGCIESERIRASVPLWSGSFHGVSLQLVKYRISLHYSHDYSDDQTHSFLQVDVKKAQTEVQTSGESPAPAKPTPLNKDTKQEGKQGDRPEGVLTHKKCKCIDTKLAT